MSVSVNRDFIQQTIDHWKHIAPVIHEPQNSDEYHKLSSFLDVLLDMVGEDESHELMGLVDVISHMITMYDEEHAYQFEKISGIDALKFLMEQHNVKQTDLREIGSQGVVSEILNGKRKLNLTQIKKLAKKFQVSPDTFID
ncbi:MAG: helix-turn-helix domain-containing protein [Legionellales bacterium]|nr:helix-turn-helix domain-containing protein [Legionellales bacterium]